MISLGLTAFVWEQAKKENPKPQLLLPVPLIGVKGKIEYEDIPCDRIGSIF